MKNQETVKYLNIMVENLQKKQGILSSLLEKTEKQKECVSGKNHENANWAQFEILMIEKDSLIEKIEEIDTAFENMFSKVKPELDTNKNEYVDQIRTLQGNIAELTDTGVKISSMEERNRADIDRIMSAARIGIGKARKNMKATSGYIASMYGNIGGVDSMQIDSKK